MLRCDVLFATRVLCIIDIRLQKVSQDAQQGIFNTAPVDFTGIFEDITQNYISKARLPATITNESKKRKPENDAKQNSQDKHGSRKPNGVWVKNNKIKPT